LIRYILELYPDSIKERDSFGRFPLHLGVMNLNFSQSSERKVEEQEQVIDLLYESCLRLGDDWKARIFGIIMEGGKDRKASIGDNEGNTILHCACMNRSLSSRLLNRIISWYPESVKIPNNRGDYPLHLSVKNGLDISIILMLVRLYPLALQKRNVEGKLPIDCISSQSTFQSHYIRFRFNKSKSSFFGFINSFLFIETYNK